MGWRRADEFGERKGEGDVSAAAPSFIEDRARTMEGRRPHRIGAWGGLSAMAIVPLW